MHINEKTQVITTAGLLTAIAIVLGFFKIPITNILEIRFAFLPVAVSGILCGPWAAVCVGALSDIGGYMIRPTGPFFPGFTISSAISGLIFGLLLHSRSSAPLRGTRETIGRIIAAQILNTLVTGIFLNSLWLSILYDNAFTIVLAARILKEIILIPINTVMLALLLKPLKLITPLYSS